MHNCHYDKSRIARIGRSAFQAALRLVWMFGLGAALAGCNGIEFPVFHDILPDLAKSEATTQFVSVPLNRTWVNVPTALIVAERGLVNSAEQRIGLPNATTVPGDNTLLLRARMPEGVETGRFRFDEFMRRVGTVPVPFTNLEPGDLITGDDALGSYFWTEYRTGDNTVCVLALRRLTSGMRQMPRNYSVLDVLLRNCVAGTVQDALRPITATHIAYGYGVSQGVPDGESRMMSPLAGPTPR